MNTQLLYHYTTPCAFNKILDCGFLRATNVSYLTDKSECRHALSRLRKIIPNIKMNKLWNSLETTLVDMPRYVVCFSKLRNNDYMWEKYGAQGTGACIVVDTTRLPREWEKFECIYSQSEQDQLLQEFSIYWKNCGENAIEDKMNLIRDWNICFKREKFLREVEVRYVLTTNKSPNKSTHSEPIVSMLAAQIFNYLNSYSQLYRDNEKNCSFQPFFLNGAIAEIILGPKYSRYIGDFGRFETTQ